MIKFLLDTTATWSSFFEKYLGGENGDGVDKGQYEVLENVFDILSIVLWVVLGIVGAFGAIYAIYLGVQLARADEQGRRDDAKKHLITVCIAVGVTIVLILFFNTFLPMILGAFVKTDIWGEDPPGGNNPDQTFITPLRMLLRV